MAYRIALVDDDRNILTSVSMVLEAEGFNVTTWYMALGPVKLPPNIVNHLNGEFAKALAIADVRKRSQDNGVDEIIGSSPQVAGNFLREEVTRWSKVLKPIPE